MRDSSWPGTCSSLGGGSVPRAKKITVRLIFNKRAQKYEWVAKHGGKTHRMPESENPATVVREGFGMPPGGWDMEVVR